MTIKPEINEDHVLKEKSCMVWQCVKVVDERMMGGKLKAYLYTLLAFFVLIFIIIMYIERALSFTRSCIFVL